MSDHEPGAARNLLTYAQTLNGGGVERAMLRLVREWHALGRDVTLLVGNAAGPLAAEIPPGVRVIDLGDGRYGALRALPRVVRATAPDILFCPGNHYSGAAAWARLRLGRDCPPVVAKISNALTRGDMRGIERAGYPLWLRLHPRFIDAFVAMSPAMKAETVRAMRVDPARVCVIANPPAVSIADAPPPPMPRGRFLIGAGRLEPQKRWDRLIAALPRIADRSVALLLLGEGSLRPALEAQVAALGLQDRVMMPGHAADPIPAIARAEAAVLTSDFEGVPGVLREALAHGTPVVATDSSVAIREIVASPELGTVIAPDDAQGLVAALDHWLAPGRARPAPVAPEGAHAASDYLALFDRLAAQRRR